MLMGCNSLKSYSPSCLLLLPSEILYVLGNLMQFLRDLDPLRTMLYAGVAADASVCLTQLWYSSVIAYQICSSCFPVVLILYALCHFACVHTFVVVQEDRRDVYSVWAWHTVFAVVARYRRVFLHEISSLIQECQFFFVKRHERRVCLQVVLEMLHICHSAQDAEYSLRSACKAECP